MNRKIIAGLSLLCAAAFAGCNNTPEVVKPQKPTDQDILLVVELDNTVAEGKTRWNEGDTFTMYSDASTTGTVLAAKANGTKVDFEGKSIDGDTFFAYYPATEGLTFEGNTITSVLPTSMSYAEASTDAAFPFAGKGNVAEGLKLSPACATIAIAVNGTCMIKSYKLEASADIAGTLSIDLSGAQPESTVSGSRSITVTDADVTVGGNKEFYLAIPAATYSSLTVTLTDMDGVTANKTFTNIAVERGKVNRLAIEYSSVVDLSYAGAANCYIVTGAGDYAFSTKLIDGSKPQGSVADWLWSDVKCDVANNVVTKAASSAAADNAEYIVSNVAYDAASGKITFHASGNLGNAVVVLCDTAKKIVWSWHIWSVGKADMLVKGWQSKTLADNEQSLDWLDRNLGATASSRADINSLGLLYQSGRKDPFIGANTLSGATESAAFGTVTRPYCVNDDFATGFTIRATAATMAESLTIPMTMVENTTKIGGGFFNWNADETVFAGWDEGASTFSDVDTWLTGSTTEALDYSDGAIATAKSLYDPCPAGYRVPTAAELWLSFLKTSTGGCLGNVLATDPTADDFSRTITDMNGQTMDLPASGQRTQAKASFGRMSTPGKATYYWSGTWTSDLACGRFVLGASELKQAFGSPAAAYAVRCVAER